MIVRPEKIISIVAHFLIVWEEKRNLTIINIKDAYVLHARQKIKNLNCNIIMENKYFYNLKID